MSPKKPMPQTRPNVQIDAPVDTQISWINGQPADSVPVDDRALHFGDGAFRTVRVWDSAVDDLAGQVALLASACIDIGIALDTDAATQEFTRAAAQLRHGVLKMIVSRGSATARGYRPQAESKQRRILLSGQMPSHKPRIAIVPPVALVAAGLHPALQGKHLNRLPQVLAQSAAVQAGVDDALLMNQHHHIVCASSANLFLIHPDGAVQTPPISDGALPGRMRARFMASLSEHGIAVTQAAITADMLTPQSALLLSNSVNGVWPLHAARVDRQFVEFTQVPEQIARVAAQFDPVPTDGYSTRGDTPNLRP